MTLPALMNTYGRLPVSFVRGEGVRLFDEQGKAYIDGISGIGVNALGHAHPAVTEAICKQAGELLHTSNLYNVVRQQELAEALRDASGMDNVFFANSGAEGNEAAIKLARMHGHKRGIEVPHVVVMEQAFHGRTLATLTASGNRKIQAGFEPLVRGFTRAPYGDLEALENIARNNSSVAAVLLEPLQGEGGLNPLPAGFLGKLRELCDRYDWLLMLDEVQTGNGRTGKYFCFQHEDVIPDVLVTAKGLGNGLPIGACLAHGKAASLFQPGAHGSTFGGNPLACAAGLVVVNTLNTPEMLAQIAETGDYLQNGLRERLAGAEHVKEVRGRGLMIGVELDRPCGGLVAQALEKGLLMNVTSERVVRLLPPLIISRQDVDALLDILCPLILQWPAHSGAA
ncbi:MULTISPECIES: aspartate aminotransferase family protein [Spongiibacter]|jgi:acetylornithine/N-succinyldiaminopimelate aminotransferase|uniref:aspartate aminotransferase family protein n=1 Tax=Spongiibacter TaxID=630749 RepID=UPI001B1F4721|nr:MULTISPECIES: aspartate aminotransferase family protein [Spongiibacter]MBO6752780.1 aspartate aminotransferase family protein [Spongiibacter sp.]|tara:strand:- start:5836 stop:7026 length:1191 start_codon:yes stop_codon:yes gene_type:complete